MEKENEIKTVIPVLRFPEFIKTKGWEIILIGNIGETYGGLTGKNKTDFGYGEKYVTYKQVYNNSSVNIAHCDFVCINSSEKQNLVKFGDILFTQSSETPEEVGISSVMLNETNEAIYLNSFCFGLRPFDLKKISPYFSKYLFRSQIFRDRIIPLAQGITRFNISPTKFKTIKIPIPTSTYNDEENTEQQKIADCLSSLDELIEATAQKVDALKEHKKGLMQRLFPAEGKNVPDLRFPEFQASEKWERKIIQDICNITTGNKNTQDKKENGIYPFFVRSPKVERIDSWSFDGEAILTAGDGVGVGKIFHYYVGKMGVHQRVYLLYDIQCNSKYLYYFFSEFFYERVKKMSAKNSVDSVRKDMISDMPLLLPSSQEQQKIADCLSSLDELIEATSQKVEILKEHKKGLMQQLFPKI